jgi:cold shock CspA family protein
MNENTEQEARPEVVYGEVIQGKIVKTNEERGYGFIVSAERRFVKFFFHWTSLRPDTLSFKDLKPGMTVQFTEAQSISGWRAVQISVIEKE